MSEAIVRGDDVAELSAKQCKMATAAPSNGAKAVHRHGDEAKSDEELFDGLFPVLLQDLIGAGQADVETRDAFNWYKQVCKELKKTVILFLYPSRNNCKQKHFSILLIFGCVLSIGCIKY